MLMSKAPKLGNLLSKNSIKIVSGSKLRCNLKYINVRYISDTPDKVFTKLSDENDPQRDAFFKYSWGSWMKNDAIEKEKRVTKFSIEGLNDVLNDIYEQTKVEAKVTKEGAIKPPSFNKNLTVSLPHNLTVKNIGVINPNEKVQITSMASIHEGKHHRIYKIDTNLGKSFVLRVPYALENEDTIAQRLKSEVASMDFADLKLGIKVPKTYCFGINGLNPIRQPFILQEYIDGKLLMRDWSPLENDTSDGKPPVALQDVINKLSEFQSKLISMKFNGFGSIYFAKDAEELENVPELYDNETNEELKGRWKLGYSVERCLWKKKSFLPTDKLKTFLGPWSINKPTDIIRATGLLEAENAKVRLGLKEADSSSEAVESGVLKSQVATFENLVKLAPSLINSETKSIPNISDLLLPRLKHPDLDPMNVLVTENNEVYLLDFEGSSIKPLILQNAPQFVAYDGPKVYNIEKEVPDYEKLSDSEKAQYEFMYKRTRNQFLWEMAFNKTNPEFISIVAPPVKLLRSPYIAAIERKTDEEYILVDEAMIQLKEIWDIFTKNGLVKNSPYPIEYTTEQLEQHGKDLLKFHEKLISQPFAATQGWIPQDMFENLVAGGVLVKNKSGDYEVSSEAQSEVQSEVQSSTENKD
ncbi:hypothetical protein Kpol_387p10 [Vanderwaltozyma polyspora DSM 70294]|uniref:Altered inheritance of mitochondria protein 9, mitochondrial n=1 Tax=Vanderwaltozyma polyspora (strain ATCC 22028 / DSM 70294 / BCRC 21397 / CBS 2163 / NBRC 10782 / NRRL Y-8283 / UCD 57-17) TaxID=436907 RepID=AIM9_VANPO|nr:uncharacterized protein Kpol_387p10 [Vanderwaltozyma polyspora DSM 70294]A7TRX9.1 RecName: Full=Altered inheritance of mitochondria protein 9, mitochondrial; AltName: Full=Found in mitochondrial proteome protein 29; Flags: Precursor [Vanderwaltozyma polyspora DSM 70294]EDO14984.1 hypothetical protein Kpol_387p10 [Vanderwaltozyma polyspora DSM 70294]